jgi:CheY-like chemotaxis protein
VPDRDDAPEPDAQRLDAALLHDLNNSLAAIVAFSHMIRTDPSLPEGLRHHAAMIVAEADRTRQIVANLVDTSTSTSMSTAAQTAAGEDAAGDTDTGPGTDEPSRPSRILVIDDEPAIREFLARILRRSGYEVTLAAAGPSALEIVRTDPPDAILCDHRMVGMSGIAFHEAVEAIDPGLARRFAFMSGDVLNAELNAFAVGRNIALLAKPFDIESVDRAVGGLVGPVQPVD